MATEKNLNNLVINKVENKTVYDYMKANNLVNVDELYLVIGQDENATEAESGLMSAADKTKLDGIAEGAEVNVQSDWNVTNTTSDAYIKNKPTALLADGGNADTVNNHTVETNVPADAVFTDTTYSVVTTSKNGLMSYSDKTKLDSIEDGAQVNVQADWNQNDNTQQDYVKNKPLIATDDDILNFLVDIGAVVPITNLSGEILISSFDEIYYL